MAVSFIWLVICQDVERNPGPRSLSSPSELSILHLNIRSIRNKRFSIRIWYYMCNWTQLDDKIATKYMYSRIFRTVQCWFWFLWQWYSYLSTNWTFSLWCVPVIKYGSSRELTLFHQNIKSVHNRHSHAQELTLILKSIWILCYYYVYYVIPIFMLLSS